MFVQVLQHTKVHTLTQTLTNNLVPNITNYSLIIETNSRAREDLLTKDQKVRAGETIKSNSWLYLEVEKFSFAQLFMCNIQYRSAKEVSDTLIKLTGNTSRF